MIQLAQKIKAAAALPIGRFIANIERGSKPVNTVQTSSRIVNKS